MKMKCQQSSLATSLACAMTITSASVQAQAVEFQRENMMARNRLELNGNIFKQEILKKENV